MKKVLLRMNEELKYQTIKEFGGSWRRVALKLGVSVRTATAVSLPARVKEKRRLFMGTDPPSC